MKIDRTTIAFHAANRILDEIEACGFNYTQVEEIGGMYGDFLSDSLHIANGASRLVIWDDCCDYVIKIALTEDYEKYNKHEVEVYSAAVKEGLEDGFAWCACYIPPCEDDDFYSPGVYVMEFLDGNDEEVSDSVWDYGYKQYCDMHGFDSSSYEHTDDYNDWYYGEDNDLLMEMFLKQIDEEKGYKMSRFLNSNHVNDLHSANYLFRNDSLVICDYAGWGW